MSEDLPSCWNCGSTLLVVEPDPGMDGVTDRCICVQCGEVQDDETHSAALR